MTTSPIRLKPLVMGGLLVTLAVPPLLGAAAGGGEMSLGPLRLAFYDLPSSVFCLLGLLLCLGRRSREGPAERWLAGLSLAGFGLVCLILWAPPSGVPTWLELRPGRPLIAGALLLGLSALASRSSLRPLATSHVPGTVTMVVAMTAGVTLHSAMVSLDRAGLAERLGRRSAALSTEPDTVVAPVATLSNSDAHPNLLLIVVDTLRADALDVTTELPFFTALADDGLVFSRAIAPAPWTVPSMMALMTGLYPSSLDPVGRGRPWPGGIAAAKPMPGGVPHLAGLLSAAGYRTAAFVKNPFLTGGLGLERGFDVYERVYGDTAEHGSAGQLVNAALRWAAAITRSPDTPLNHSSSQAETAAPGPALNRASANASANGANADEPAPWFLYLHFMDPHVNYQPPALHLSQRSRDYSGEIDGRASTLNDMLAAKPAPDAADVTQLKDLYAGEVRYLDEQLGRLFASLSAAGVLDTNTCVVVTADHGEQFGEHGGWMHGDIHAENVRVPLLLRGPGVPPGQRDDPASLVDLLPTLAQLLSLPSLSLGEGRNLLAPGASDSATAVHTEYGEQSRLTGPRFSLLRRADGLSSLYDLRADPREREDLADSHADVVSEMLEAMAAHVARAPLALAAEQAEVDGEQESAVELDTEALRAIGYLDG